MTLKTFIDHLSLVLKKQTEEITKLKEWMERSSNLEQYKNEDVEAFQRIIEDNNDRLSLMNNNLSYITWKLEMMNILLEDGEEEDEEEMIESEYRVIEFY